MQIKEIKHEISNLCFVAKSKEYQAGYIAMRDYAMWLLNQLDEPQKPVVPGFVAELLDYYRQSTDVDLLALLLSFHDWYYSESKNGKHEEAIDWLVKHPEIYMRAWLFGYEVEKEPLYMVPLLTDKEGNKKILVERRGQYDIIWDYENEGDWHELLTEEQIKSVNPEYWKFAVLYEPSEEVA